MRVIEGNLWEQNGCVGIPTNGKVGSSGAAIMGRGVARQALGRCPGIDRELGLLIQDNGNIVQMIRPFLFAFPSKHNWWETSDLQLIERSVSQLADMADEMPEEMFYIPLPGVGNGKLDPRDVWPLMVDLPMNVTIVVRSIDSVGFRAEILSGVKFMNPWDRRKLLDEDLPGAFCMACGGPPRCHCQNDL